MRSTLLAMLQTCRPMGSATERAFRARWLDRLPGAFTDTWGNIHVPVPRADGSSARVLWSAHTDTVHDAEGRQRITVRVAHGVPWAELARDSRVSCLGADDTVGVYLLREMIAARVPGWYVFHYGEERGGVGARQLAAKHAAWLKESFDMAIALDRADTGDVITHQGIRTASDAFARSLATALAVASGDVLAYAPCRGVYTDTREYAPFVPECTNLSVGYQGQHRPAERVDLRHVDRLRAALLTLDLSALAIERDPSVPEPVSDWGHEWDWGAWEARLAARDGVRDTHATHTSATVHTHRAKWYLSDRRTDASAIDDTRVAAILAEAETRAATRAVTRAHARAPRLTTANAAPGLPLVFDGPAFMRARPGARAWVMQLGERAVYVTWDRTDARHGDQRDGGYPYWHFVIDRSPEREAAPDGPDVPPSDGADASTDTGDPFFVRVEVP